MSSNYNTRPRAPEVMVDGANAHLAREREGTAALFAAERLPARRPGSLTHPCRAVSVDFPREPEAPAPIRDPQ